MRTESEHGRRSDGAGAQLIARLRRLGSALTLRQRQWAWFLLLWCAGLCAVAAMAYPLRWLMHGMAGA
jgi:hypothetical protein